MKRFRLLTLVTLLASIQVVSTGCHAVFRTQKYIVFTNEKDQTQVVQFSAANQPLRDWFHGMPLEILPEGEYVREGGKERIVGAYSFDGNAYLLKSPEGAPSRFSIRSDQSLLDESGTVWQRRGPQEIAMELKSYK